MLAASHKIDLDKIQYPVYASYKLDGIRAVFHPDLGLVSRSLKPIQNKQLREKFDWLLLQAKMHNRVFDGEFYSHDLTFQEITRAVMTQDFTDEKTIKKITAEQGNITKAMNYIEKLLQSIKFYCFETHHEIKENFEQKKPIIQQYKYNHTYRPVEQLIVNSKEEVKMLFEQALKDGYEGLILRSIFSPYKFGRSTVKEEYMLKVKPFETFDTKILDVIQATKVKEEAEKTINELGRSVTSRKKDDRELIEKAAAFLVDFNGCKLKVSIALTDPEKIQIWQQKEKYIGRMIEYKGLQIGMKEVPRHSVFVRFREDRD